MARRKLSQCSSKPDGGCAVNGAGVCDVMLDHREAPVCDSPIHEIEVAQIQMLDLIA